MANWREKIELHQAIEKANEEHDLSRFEEPVPEQVKDLLATAIKPSVWLARYADDIRACKSIAELNRILDRIFDAADRYKVWCGI